MTRRAASNWHTDPNIQYWIDLIHAFLPLHGGRLEGRKVVALAGEIATRIPRMTKDWHPYAAIASVLQADNDRLRQQADDLQAEIARLSYDADVVANMATAHLVRGAGRRHS